MATSALLQKPFPLLLGNDATGRVSGLLGNPIYMGGYQVFILFFIALLWPAAKDRSTRIWYGIAAMLAVGAHFAASSRGPTLALGVGIMTAGAIYAIAKGSRRLWAIMAGGFVLAAGAYGSVALWLLPHAGLAGFWARNEALKHLFTAEIEAQRLGLWKTAWAGIKERPILGWGRENFSFLFDKHYLPSTLCFGMDSTIQDQAHNLVLDTLSQTGVIGLLALVALYVALFATIISSYRKRFIGLPMAASLCGLSAAWIVNCMFAFDSPGTWATSYLLLAMVVASASPTFNADAPPPVSIPPQVLPKHWQSFAGAQAAMALLVVLTSIRPGYASYLATNASRSEGRNGVAEILDDSKKAFEIWTPYLDDQLFLLVQGFSMVASTPRAAEWPGWKDVLELERKIAGRYFEYHPAHVNLRTVHANFLRVIGALLHDPQAYAEAEQNLAQLVAQSPRRQQYRFSYARLLTELRRTDEAISQLAAALSADESQGEARWQLGTYQWQFQGKAQEGAANMVRGLDGACVHSPSNPIEVQQAFQAYALLGSTAGMKSAVQRFIGVLDSDATNDEGFLNVARFLERAGLFAERDAVLARGRARKSTLTERLRPLTSGKVRSLAELELNQAKPPQ